MKNTLLLKTTNRRNILHTKEKEKYKVQRKKQRKERKMPATPKKTCGEAGKAQKKPAMHVTSRHIISRVVNTYRSRYDLRLHQALYR